MKTVIVAVLSVVSAIGSILYLTRDQHTSPGTSLAGYVSQQAKPAPTKYVPVTPPTPAAVPTTPPAPKAAEWHFTTKKDSMSDAVFTFAGVESQSEENGIFGKPLETSLVLRCSPTGLNVLYAWSPGIMLVPDFGEESFDGEFRYNSEPAQTAKFNVLPGSNNTVAIINETFLLDHTGGTLTVRVTGMNDEKLTSTFDLTGMPDALAKLPCVKPAEPAAAPAAAQ